jgi:hypothetical protein
MGERSTQSTIDRRAFLRRAAIVAWATPVVLTLSQSRAGAQTTCVPCGQACINRERGGVPCCTGCECFLGSDFLNGVCSPQSL